MYDGSNAMPDKQSPSMWHEIKRSLVMKSDEAVEATINYVAEKLIKEH
jgi:signal recognition particle subunit SEC65